MITTSQKSELRIHLFFNNAGIDLLNYMPDTFIVHDLYMPRSKISLRSEVKPLTCYICKKELNGMSITAKIIDGQAVFLCSHHMKSELQQLVPVS